MSLIDQALKRAEAQKPSRDPSRPGSAGGTGRAPNARGVFILAVFAIGGVAAVLRISSVFHSPARPASGGDQPSSIGYASPAGDAPVSEGPLPAGAWADLADYEPPPRPAAKLASSGLERKPAAPTTKASQPPTPSPMPPPADEDIGKFELGGIMRSGEMANAIVNGQAVSVGDTVDGAEVVEISPRRVVLVKRGRRIVLGM